MGGGFLELVGDVAGGQGEGTAHLVDLTWQALEDLAQRGVRARPSSGRRSEQRLRSIPGKPSPSTPPQPQPPPRGSAAVLTAGVVHNDGVITLGLHGGRSGHGPGQGRSAGAGPAGRSRS
ncbi:hypothetical protein KPATCC21470_0060 [Kitasatospora purpeofusca]